MSHDNVQIRDDVQLEVTNHDQPGKQAKKQKLKPRFTNSNGTEPEATAPAEAESAAFEADAVEDAKEADSKDTDNRLDDKRAAANTAVAGDDAGDENLPELDSIDEAAWTAQDENHLIIDRPHEWTTQDYENHPPPRVDFRRPVDDDISSTM